MRGVRGVWMGVALVALAAGSAPAAAQGALVACPSQEAVEAALAGTPQEECRMLEITVVEAQAGPLCAIHFGSVIEEFASGMAPAVGDLPATWWVPCDQVGP
jgi:hypothetical protein